MCICTGRCVDTCFPARASFYKNEIKSNTHIRCAWVHLWDSARVMMKLLVLAFGMLSRWSAGDILSSDEQTGAFLLQWDIDAFHDALYWRTGVWKGNKRAWRQHPLRFVAVIGSSRILWWRKMRWNIDLQCLREALANATLLFTSSCFDRPSESMALILNKAHFCYWEK